MKVAILGAGVIGVTSAYYLARAGHEVTVIDRQEGPALETSFANAGQVSPGYSAPWAAPGIPLKAIKWLMMEHAPLILHAKNDLGTIRWLGELLKNCTSARYAVNKSRMVRVAEYSRDCLKELRAGLDLPYDGRQQGTLQLFRSQKQVEAMAKDVAVLKADGVPFEVLDTEGCIAAEPGLAAARDKIVGGLRLPGDETGDCFLFTNALAQECERLGVTFQYGTSIDGLVTEGDRVTGIRTGAGLVTADAIVTALGSYATAFLKPLGIRLPVSPVKGYSITAPIVDAARAPASTVMDETFKVAITRLGDRIRVGGMAEIAGFDLSLSERRRATLLNSLDSLFGGAADTAQASFWSGLRPMTPDGTPIIGRTKFRNLWLNAGHGTLGWTMSCGSARVLADLVSGGRPEIDATDLGLERYSAPRRRPAAAPAAAEPHLA
ncbi:D-amino acid dehydrogenase [Poseidonocella sp. HB161398]|uniref:D-amino acid dehydrogenase n=1 Tax=Poseidonocella sp. HB161398 TaxID=2320855 RepID=UPI0011084061|nr:D-amino acid dehydrogenase [Poseidonocella sp. HB161398]